MKRKYYLRGIGIGIIFTAVIMSIGYNTSYKNKISDKEIIVRAKELGMVEGNSSNLDNLLSTTPSPTPAKEAGTDNLEPGGTTETSTEPEPSTEPETTKDADTTEEAGPTNTPETTKDTESGKDVKQTPTQEVDKEDTEPIISSDKTDDTQNNSVEEEKKVMIEITEGMSSETVAKLLKSNGIIEDSDAFNQYLIINKYTKRIRVGTYEIEPYLSYQMIADMIIFKKTGK